MSTFANSEDPDKKQHDAAYTVCIGKKDFRQKNTIYFENYNSTPLDMYNPKLIVSNQKEESIRLQRVSYMPHSDPHVHELTVLYSRPI